MKGEVKYCSDIGTIIFVFSNTLFLHTFMDLFYNRLLDFDVFIRFFIKFFNHNQIEII